LRFIALEHFQNFGLFVGLPLAISKLALCEDVASFKTRPRQIVTSLSRQKNSKKAKNEITGGDEIAVVCSLEGDRLHAAENKDYYEQESENDLCRRKPRRGLSHNGKE